MSLKITNVDIRKSQYPGAIKAFVTITFDDCMICENFRIIEGSKGLYVVPPSRPDKKEPGKFWDIIRFPDAMDINKPGGKFRQYLQKTVLGVYGSEYGNEEEFNQTNNSDTDSFDNNEDDDVPF